MTHEHLENFIFFPERLWRKLTRNTYWRSRYIEEKRRADALDDELTSYIMLIKEERKNEH